VYEFAQHSTAKVEAAQGEIPLCVATCGSFGSICIPFLQSVHPSVQDPSPFHYIFFCSYSLSIVFFSNTSLLVGNLSELSELTESIPRAMQTQDQQPTQSDGTGTQSHTMKTTKRGRPYFKVGMQY
jgi:hypothetical protein